MIKKISLYFLCMIIILLIFNVFILHCKAEEDSIKYNPYENTYEYATKDAVPTYNPYENKFEFAEPGSVLKYNPFENTYEYVSPPKSK